MPRRKSLTRSAMAYLVGAGPGDLQLLTLRARDVLARADVVIYDFLANERLLDWAPKAKTIYVGKREGKHTLSQDEINALLVREAAKGKQVVRLKGGDPFLFGRGGEEGRALAEAGLPFEIVPGVTSALAVPAYAGIPVTERNSSASLAIVTGHEHPDKAEPEVNFTALAGMGTVVFLMGMKTLEQNLTGLRNAGVPADRPAAAVQWGTRSDQHTVVGTLATLPQLVKEQGLGSPAIVVVGEVVKSRTYLNWYESRPWFGKRIVVTRSRDAAPGFVDEIEHRGAAITEVPSIAFAAPDSYESLDSGIARLGKYQWVVFTSANGVDYFWTRLREQGKDARALGNAKIAVVGPATAKALEKYGLVADAVPDEFRAASLAAAIGIRRLKGKRVLLVRAAEGSDDFLTASKLAGAKTDLAVAYQTVAAKRPKDFRPLGIHNRAPDLVVFASPSAVRSYWKMLTPAERKALAGSPVACIGPVTAESASKTGFRVAVTPKENTLEGLLEAMDYYFRSQKET